MLDIGIDQFFGSANDLVVPSEGGWRVDPSGGIVHPGARIGCFGPGGNLDRGDVTHVNFFSQPETVDVSRRDARAISRTSCSRSIRRCVCRIDG